MTRSHQIGVRFNDLEYELLQRKAQEIGLPLATCVRALCLGTEHEFRPDPVTQTRSFLALLIQLATITNRVDERFLDTVCELIEDNRHVDQHLYKSMKALRPTYYNPMNGR